MKRVVRVLLIACIVAGVSVAGATLAVAKGLPIEPAGVAPEKFEPASYCGCHATFVEQWSQTMHAHALTDPLYLAKVEEADKATGGKLGPFCKKCHGPAATITGEIARGGKLSEGTGQGVTCSFCHQVVSMKKGRPANTSLLVEPSGVRRAQLKDPQAPHKTAYSELHTKAEFCGSCHNVDHPVNGMHLETTYAEWSKGPYAKDGVVCQDCHMSRRPGEVGPSTGRAVAGAPERDNIYRMSFMGAQVALGNADLATAMLKSAAEIALEVPEIMGDSRSAKAKVTITNVGAGHYLPTGLTEVRQMWLEVAAAGPDGKSVKVGEHRFGTILQDDKGNSPVELWEATKIKSDDRIPPKESVTYEYELTLPEGMDSATLKAALLYKSVPDELAEKAAVENPTTEMAVAEQAVYASTAAKSAAARSVAEAGLQPDGEPTNKAMWFAIAGLAVAAALGLYFWMRSRRTA